MENTKITTFGTRAVGPRTDDDNPFLKQMVCFRSDYMKQIDAKFDKIFDIIASMQLHLQTQVTTKGNGSRFDFCDEDTKFQHQIVAATPFFPTPIDDPETLAATQAITNPTSLTNLESSLPNDLPPLVCSHENNIEEGCFVETPLPTPFPSQPPKRSHSLPPPLASEHKIEGKSGYSHDGSESIEKIEADIVEISSGILSNTLNAIVEKETVLNPFTKETTSETMKLLKSRWVPIGVYGVFTDHNVQNYLVLNKCFEVHKVNGGLNFNFRYRRKKRWSCGWRAEWLKLNEKLKEQFVNGWFPTFAVVNENSFQATLIITIGYASAWIWWKNYQDDPLLSSVGLDGNIVVSLAFRMKSLLDFLDAEMTFYDGSLYLVTTDWNVAIHGLPKVYNFNQKSFGFRNSGFHGRPLIVKIFCPDRPMNAVSICHTCKGVSLADHFVGPGMTYLHYSSLLQPTSIVIIFFKANSPTFWLCNVSMNWVKELSNCPSAIDLSASKSLSSWRIKLSSESHFSFFNMFYVVTTRSFGVEDSIQAAEPILVFKELLGYSFTWSVRGALVELDTMFLEKGSYVVWKWIIWDQIWFCGISGIRPEFESFKDDGLTAIPSRWNGKCREREEFNLSQCKRKLIGARWYIKDYEAEFGSLHTKGGAEFLSARDAEGHGTHTSSIVAGTVVENVSFSRLARGGAPATRLAIFKVFWTMGSCCSADIFVAFDDAIWIVVNGVTVVVGISVIMNLGTLVLGHLQLSRGDTTHSRGEYCHVHNYD